MAFGDQLKLLREEKGVTQKDIGKLLNISDRVIGYYEQDNRFPKDENTLIRLADFFEVSVDFLLGQTDIRTSYKDKYNNMKIIDVSNLPEEAIKLAEEYIEFLKQKYPKK